MTKQFWALIVGLTVLAPIAVAPTAVAFGVTGAQSNCAPAAGLNLAIGEPPQPGPAGSVDGTGNLTLYCRGAATNSRDGTYTAGINSAKGAPPIAGQSCSVNIGYESAQVLGQSYQESEYQPGAVTVYPFAFWTGTIDADIVPASGSFGDFWGSLTDTAPAGLGVDWAAASRYGPAAPSAQPNSGLATGGLVMSGLENETLEVSLRTVSGDAGKWEQTSSGEWLCDEPRLSLTVRPVTDTDTPPSSTPPAESAWTLPTLEQAMASTGVTAGQVQTGAPDNYMVFAPTTFWISPQPQGPDLPPTVMNVMGDPDADGESIVFTYYLDVTPSDTINWNFGDGTTGTSQADSSGPGEVGVTHYYKQISGERSVPAAGPTVTATQDVTVTAFVAWVAEDGNAYYGCVTPAGGIGPVNPYTQATAVAACSTTYAQALVDTALPPKPVYQVRAIPVSRDARGAGTTTPTPGAVHRGVCPRVWPVSRGVDGDPRHMDLDHRDRCRGRGRRAGNRGGHVCRGLRHQHHSRTH